MGNNFTTDDGVVLLRDKIVGYELISKLEDGKKVYKLKYSDDTEIPEVILTKGEFLMITRLSKQNSAKLEQATLTQPSSEDAKAELEAFRQKIAGNSDKVAWTHLTTKDKSYSLSWVNPDDYRLCLNRGYSAANLHDLENPENLMDNRPGESTKADGGLITHQGLILMKIRRDFKRVLYQETNKDQNKLIARTRKSSAEVYQD